MENFHSLLNGSIIDTLKIAHKIVNEPRLIKTALHFAKIHEKAAKVRENFLSEGVMVPPVLIISLTERCNLSCQGCYMKALSNGKRKEMSCHELYTLINEAGDLGVLFIVFSGGEPFTRAEVILISAKNNPDLLFPVYTNGLLLDDTLISKLEELPNIIPIISIDGGMEGTDKRRGDGVYKTVIDTFSWLKEHHIFFGCSITVTLENLSIVTDEAFVKNIITAGCRLFSYVEYVPVDGNRTVVLSEEDRKVLLQRVNSLSNQNPAIFIALPGDEAKFGGCLSAGRGFAYINVNGDLQPCPAGPFSDANVTKTSLKEALKSRSFEILRENHHLLSEGYGGCALWANRDEVNLLLTEK